MLNVLKGIGHLANAMSSQIRIITTIFAVTVLSATGFAQEIQLRPADQSQSQTPAPQRDLSYKERVFPVVFGQEEMANPIECRVVPGIDSEEIENLVININNGQQYVFQPDIGIDNPGQPFGFDLAQFRDGEVILKYRQRLVREEAGKRKLIDVTHYLTNHLGGLSLVRRDVKYNADADALLKEWALKDIPKTVAFEFVKKYELESVITADEVERATRPHVQSSAHDSMMPKMHTARRPLATISLNEIAAGREDDAHRAELVCEARRDEYLY